MEDIVSYILSGGTYSWLAAGLLLIIAEMAIASNWLLWPGIAALLTSVFLYFSPDLPWTGAVVIFVALSIIFLYLGRRFVKFSGTQPTDSPNLNARAARMVGRRGAATLASQDGMSRVQIDGVEWPVRLAEHAPIALNEALEITGFDGTTLVAKIIVIK